MRRFLALIIAAASALAIGLVPAVAPATHAQEDSVPTEITALVDLLFSGDTDALRDALVITQVECEGPPAIDYVFPDCAEGVADGTLVDAFPKAGCEGAYFTSEYFDLISEGLATPGAEFVGLYRASSEQIGLMRGEYAAVYRSITGEGFLGAVWLTSSGITSVYDGCGQSDGIHTVEVLVDHFDLEGPISGSPSDLPSTGYGASDEASGSQSWMIVLALAGLLFVSGSAFAGVQVRRD